MVDDIDGAMVEGPAIGGAGEQTRDILSVEGPAGGEGCMGPLGSGEPGPMGSGRFIREA